MTVRLRLRTRKWAYDELDDKRQQLLEPRQNLLFVAPEDGVQDVRHFGQDVDVVLVLVGGENKRFRDNSGARSKNHISKEFLLK